VADDKHKRHGLADTLPAAPPVHTPGSIADLATQVDVNARYTVSDTMPIPEVPEPELPTERISSMPSGMHERGKLGRFDILDVIGQGGMGVVIAAYDPQLDRKVAIKVLRTKGLTGKRRDKETARLQREARAMAQLSHPHVVTVYEAGVIDDRVYIAMEYIAGQTLRAWLDDKPRSVDEILDVYSKAGLGLAAGHQAGLIHRDFKPDNVLVGFDGRVRVIDFGLARPARLNDTPSPTDDSAEVTDVEVNRLSSQLLHERLTTVGTLFGTPIYMAPEQHQKLELDGRADQFAFCVALYEALYSALPFTTSSYVELATAVSEGRVKVPPTRSDIPLRVVEAVLRGLQPDPERRFPSMNELLDALSPPPPKRSSKLVVALAGVAAISIAVVVVLLMRGTTPEEVPCLDGLDRVRGVWDDGVRAEVKRAFLASGRSHRETTLKKVTDDLDRYTETWVAARRTICEATKVRHEQSEAAFDLRMQCISDRLAGLGALGQLFAKADPAIVDKALPATRNLGDSSACVTLTSAIPAPSPAQAAQLERLRPELAAARAQSYIGRYDRASVLAQQTIDHAKDLDYPPFQCEAQQLLGWTLLGTSKPVEGERALRVALELAAKAKNDQMVAATWNSLITTIGSDPKRYDEALGLEQYAEVAIQRADNNQTLRGELAYAIGGVALNKGDYERAIARFEGALALPAGAIDEQTRAQCLNALGGAYLRAGNIFGAKDAFQKAVVAAKSAFGGDHPDVAVPLSNLGGLAQAMGAWDEAIGHHMQALKIIEETRGPAHEQTGQLLYSLAVSRNGKEDFKGALPYYERALAIFEAISPSHGYVGLSLVGIADCLEETGDPKRGVIAGERALTLVETMKDPVQLALARFILAKALWAANLERPRARKLAEQARDGFKAGGLAALNGLAAVDMWFKKIDAR
jgi:tetratricopeptide (TPR) repeat protein/tRNA A-37 threonylcarbamoyl transferase component Bud32